MIETIEKLTDKELELVPFDSAVDYEYLCHLVTQYKYNTINNKNTMIELIDRYGKYFWRGLVNGVSVGVLFLIYSPEFDRWSLHAYIDKEIFKVNKEYPYKAGKLVRDYYFETTNNDWLFTAHDIRNVQATKLCKKLGFYEVGHSIIEGIGDLIDMAMTRDIWELRRKYGT